MIEITESLKIPDDEIVATVSASSGPGGQNVNRVRTRVTLAFNVLESGSLSGEEKARIAERLGSRLDRRGVLRVRSQKHRTQGQNRTEATRRLATILADALSPPRLRRKTRKPPAADRRRLEAKRRRSGIKAARSRPGGEDD